ncbi:MAG: hypothetical protein NT062_38040 [Proteobacteria bacterium]|nr:hypothetical protein [Pseudomonadota bacterium]
MRMATMFGLGLLCACGSDKPGAGDRVDADPNAPDTTPVGIDAPTAGRAINTIFVIPFENKANAQIYGNTTDAPYLNGLLATAASATMFGDALPSLPSEPHYVWMEAGTNVFADHTFSNDDDPSAANSTASTAHLSTTLAAGGVSWMSYQEGITSATCPIAGSGHYAPKHDPFVFFQDVVGSPPTDTAIGCASHHKSYDDFAGDLAGGGLHGYVFITPDLCHDMHGALTCASLLFTAANITAGDTWLSTELPRLIAYTQAHADAVIFLTWDEGNSTNVIPFLAIGQHVKAGHVSTVPYTHSSLVASVQKLLGVPLLPAVTSANDFSDLFEPGVF